MFVCGNFVQETEHEKILFYYPASASLSQQLSDVGLAEAFVNFSRTFSPDRYVTECVSLPEPLRSFLLSSGRATQFILKRRGRYEVQCQGLRSESYF
jgi:hypothetical protein